jgi:RP/EB family microtubule-associated protein
MEMKLTVEGLEKERDFYFGKLRDVEVLCQEHELTGGPVVRKVRKLDLSQSKCWGSVTF